MSAETSESDPRPELNSGSFRDRQKESDQQLPVELLSDLQDTLGEGAELFLVGGALRDLFLKRSLGDVDLATNLLPQELTKRLKGHHRVIPTGIQHGTVTVLTDQRNFEITTFRSDGDYLDGRRPQSVNLGVALEEDLARRDFTINAMALPVKAIGRQGWEGQVVDPFGGREDLWRKLIRAVGDPLKRFAEDGLRPLRACRFAAQLEFEVDRATLDAIPQRLDVSRKVAVERVFVEVTKLLTGQDPARGLRLLETTGLLDLWLPELRPLVGCTQNRHHRFDVWEHTLHALGASWKEWRPACRVPGQSNDDELDPEMIMVLSEVCEPVIRWTLLLHDLGKPSSRTLENGEAHFYGHEKVSAEMADSMLRRLHASNQLREMVLALIRLHGEHPTKEWTDPAWRRLLKRIAEADPRSDIRTKIILWYFVRLADQWGKGWANSASTSEGKPGFQWWDETFQEWRWVFGRLEALALNTAVQAKQLALDGHALMTLAGRPGGPWLGKLQAHLLERVLEDPRVNTPEGLEAHVRLWLGVHLDL